MRRIFVTVMLAIAAMMLGGQTARADSICVRPYVSDVSETVCVRLP